MIAYNAAELHTELLGAMHRMYPAFRSLKVVVAGPTGSGKSTLLASIPVPAGKKRLVLDNEDSMAFLDNGPTGQDIYTPRRQRFAMERYPFATVRDYATAYGTIVNQPETVGAVLIDNLAVMQDTIVDTLLKIAGHPKAWEHFKDLMGRFDIPASALPHEKTVQKWVFQKPGEFWYVAKLIPKQIIMACGRAGIHILVASEQSNIWEKYGTSDQKLVGKRAKVWDVWERYMDSIIVLERNPNTTNPPFGTINPMQPKMRMQGMNAKWVMDWPGFIKEINEAATREEAEIPKEAQVEVAVLTEEVDA
jgi:hypothetical protein